MPSQIPRKISQLAPNDTGAANRAALGLAIGTDVMACDGDGSAIAATSPIGSTSRTLANRLTDAINVLDFGVVADAVQRTNGAMAASSAILTGSGFVASDVGKPICVAGAGASGDHLLTTIAIYQSSAQVTLAASATTTVSSATYTYGTDNTASIQALLDGAAVKLSGPANPSQANNCRDVRVPAGNYAITSDLKVHLRYGLGIIGENWQRAVIFQLGSNLPIINFDTDNTHSTRVDGLTLQYAGKQDPTRHPHSYGIAYTNPGPTYNGNYHQVFRNLKIVYPTVGIGIDNGGATMPVWGNEYAYLMIVGASLSAAVFQTVNVGSPCNRWAHIKVFNTATGVTPTGTCMSLRGEVSIECLDVEGWANYILFHTSGVATVRTVHIEHHILTKASRFFEVNNATMNLDGVTFTADVSTAATTHSFISLLAGGKVTARGITVNTLPTTGQIALVTGGAPTNSSCSLAAINYGSSGSLYGSPDSGTNQSPWSMTTIDGLPPVIPAVLGLPTASSAYEGRQFWVKGGAGVASHLYCCLKAASDSYSWVQIA